MNLFILSIIRISFCLLIVVQGFQCQAIAANTAVAPDVEVQIDSEQKAISKPSWKKIWDMARELARANELEKAKKKYNDLFEKKPNIAEARWEYCKLLILLNGWEAASMVIEGLIEVDPNNHEYLVLAGGVELKNQRYKNAVKYFGQVYEEQPTGSNSVEAIKGLVEAFNNLGNEKSEYLLLEQLFQREKDNPKLLNKLAILSKKLGHLDKARFYYARLVDDFAVDPITLYNAALIHFHPGFKKKAVEYWKKYLIFDENILLAHEQIAQYYTELNKTDLALPHLLKIYKSKQLSAELALRIGTIYYRVLSRPDKGLFYFEQYNKVFSDDSAVAETINEMRSALAKEYLPIVDNNGAERLWVDLDHITIDREGLFLKMANLFKKDGRIVQEATLLKILLNHQTDNFEVGFRLAKLYSSLSDFNSAYFVLTTMDLPTASSNKYLLLRAHIEEKLGKEESGLLTLRKYLLNNPENIDAITKAIYIAGKLGLVTELYEIWQNAWKKIRLLSDKIGVGLTYIEALRINGHFSSSAMVYKEIILLAKDDQQVLARINFHKADSLYLQELVFEAEQTIRQVLAKNVAVNEAIAKLTKLSIKEEQLAWARSWLYLFAARVNVNDIEDENVDLPEDLFFLYIELLLAEEEYDEAEDKLLQKIEKIANNTKIGSSAYINKANLYLTRLYFFSENFNKCNIKIEEQLKRHPEDVELHVLKDIIETILSNDSPERVASSTFEQENRIFSRLIKKAELYSKYGSHTTALKNVRVAKKLIPNSITAKLLEIKILTSLARYSEALKKVADVVEAFPELDYFDRLQLQLEFKSGNFKQIVKNLPIEEKAPASLQKNNSDKNRDLFFQERLLLARSLWAENRRDEAIKIYNSLLVYPVDTIFLEKVEVENVNFLLPPLKKSFWNIITFTNPPQPDPIKTVMDPQFFANNIGQPVDDIAASLYGKYRWQKLVKRELAARKASENRDFYQAEKEYRSLLKEEKSNETLFDLASIYSRFGQYGKEAELYEMMKAKGPLYPGLDEYIKANTLKRQPRVSSTFSTSSRLRRNGYINLKKKSIGIEGWLMPTLDQEVNFSFIRNFYTPVEGKTKKSWSNRFTGTYSTYYEDKYDLNISAGSDRPTGPGTNEILFKFEMIGRFNESIQGYGRFEQDLVEDTISSVDDSVIYRDFDAGLKIDVFPRWFLGGDFRYRMYSDDNEQNRYKVWSMYHLFGESNQFKIKYSYENIRNTSGNLGKNSYLSIDFAVDDRTYWSPKHYWQHLFTIHYKHLFDIEHESETPLSYCSVDYSYGYEDGDGQSHTFDINIFLEINRHFLLKGSLVNQNSGDYKKTETMMSLIYRW